VNLRSFGTGLMAGFGNLPSPCRAQRNAFRQGQRLGRAFGHWLTRVTPSIIIFANLYWGHHDRAFHRPTIETLLVVVAMALSARVAALLATRFTSKLARLHRISLVAELIQVLACVGIGILLLATDAFA
jgi:hypothetical protein